MTSYEDDRPLREEWQEERGISKDGEGSPFDQDKEDDDVL